MKISHSHQLWKVIFIMKYKITRSSKSERLYIASLTLWDDVSTNYLETVFGL